MAETGNHITRPHLVFVRPDEASPFWCAGIFELPVPYSDADVGLRVSALQDVGRGLQLRRDVTLYAVEVAASTKVGS